jgi:hypothetical protein
LVSSTATGTDLIVVDLAQRARATFETMKTMSALPALPKIKSFFTEGDLIFFQSFKANRRTQSWCCNITETRHLTQAL